MVSHALVAERNIHCDEVFPQSEGWVNPFKEICFCLHGNTEMTDILGLGICQCQSLLKLSAWLRLVVAQKHYGNMMLFK